VSSWTTNVTHAFLWDSVDGIRARNDPTQFTLYNPDGTLATGWVLVNGLGINGYGQIIGWGYNPAGQQRIFLRPPR